MNREETVLWEERSLAKDEALEDAARIAERVCILDAMTGVTDVRPFGKEIAAEIRSLKKYRGDEK